MVFLFDLKCKDNSEQEITADFCKFIVDNIKDDIINRTNVMKIDVISRKILDLDWIDWKVKPLSINPYYLLNIIANSVEYNRIRNLYSIGINNTVCYPGSNTKLERFVRFLDKGNMTIKGSYVFTEIFSKYARNIDEYWDMYKSHKLKKYDIDNSFIIK